MQVEGAVTTDAIKRLEQGVELSINGKRHVTQPCKAKVFEEHLIVPERNPPIRFRKNIPATWISVTLTEGKNRQVRRMTAHVGFPTLRLIRNRIENISLNNLQPGDLKELSEEQIYQALFRKGHLNYGVRNNKR